MPDPLGHFVALDGFLEELAGCLVVNHDPLGPHNTRYTVVRAIHAAFGSRGSSFEPGAARFCTIVGPENWHSGIPRQANWFNYPPEMCKSLDALGFVAGGWAPAAQDSPVYMCAYPPGARPADKLANQQFSPKVRFEVTYEVNGLHRTTADTITLTVASANPAKA